MPPEEIYNEQELLARLSSGDTLAFRSVFDKYSRHVYVLALRFTKSPLLAEDLTQDIFARIWMNRAGLANVQQFRPYLNTVAKNLARDYLKKKVIAVDTEPYMLAFFGDVEPTPEERMALKELENVLHKAVAQLTPQLKMAFTLSRQEGLTHEEIARRMNISSTTSKSHLVRALASIRQYLHKHYPLLSVYMCNYLLINFL